MSCGHFCFKRAAHCCSCCARHNTHNLEFHRTIETLVECRESCSGIYRLSKLPQSIQIQSYLHESTHTHRSSCLRDCKQGWICFVLVFISMRPLEASSCARRHTDQQQGPFDGVASGRVVLTGWRYRIALTALALLSKQCHHDNVVVSESCAIATIATVLRVQSPGSAHMYTLTRARSTIAVARMATRLSLRHRRSLAFANMDARAHSERKLGSLSRMATHLRDWSLGLEV